jgi:hypothetical protein
MKTTVFILALNYHERNFRNGMIPKRLRKYVSKSHKTIFILTTNFHHSTVVVKFPGSWNDRLLKCKEVVNKMGTSTWMAGLTIKPTLSVVTTAIDDADIAMVAAKTRVSGSAATKNAKITDAMILVYQLCNFVQAVCDQHPDHETEVAESCGMYITAHPGQKAFEFSVKATGLDGEAELQGKTRRIARPDHEFQLSTDPSDPKKWYDTIIPVSKKAKVKVGNLPVKTKLYFRHRWITSEGPGEWSQIINIELLH